MPGVFLTIPASEFRRAGNRFSPEWLSTRRDQTKGTVWSIVFQTMRKEKLTEVLTSDQHFEQEGFRALFRDS
jgi:predicted nucleic acid-binding protein